MSHIVVVDQYEDANENEAAIVKWGRDFYIAYQPRESACGCGGGWRCGGGFGNSAMAAVLGLGHDRTGQAERGARMLLRDARAELVDAGYTVRK